MHLTYSSPEKNKQLGQFTKTNMGNIWENTEADQLFINQNIFIAEMWSWDYNKPGKLNIT